MGKTELTLQLEKDIHSATKKTGLVGCFEVTIGKGGNERVDYITFDTKNIVRCYEIKVSKSDFYSSAKKTFIGHYNYYVMPKELFDIVEKDIPKHIGVYCGSKDGKYYGFIKNPQKQELSVDLDVIKTSMMFGLYREAKKGWDSKDTDNLAQLKNTIAFYKKEADVNNESYREARNNINIISIYLRKNNLPTVDDILEDYN